jgi:hypothetical protein
MRYVTLIFPSLQELLDFQDFIDLLNSDVIFGIDHCTGTFTEAQIELAMNGMGASVESPNYLMSQYRGYSISNSSISSSGISPWNCMALSVS